MSSQAVNSGVVVGVDGSRSSKRAVQWAAHEARMRNVPLTLVHVVVTPSWGPAPWLLSNAPLPLPAEEDPALEKSGRKIIADAIKIADESTRETGRPEINSELFFSVPVPTLVGLSKEARIVVVGRRGQHRLRGVLLGSVSTGLIHHAHCPVAVIGDAAPIGPKDPRRPVVVGIDGSPASELATEIAFDEASRRRVDLVAIHAWRDADLSKGMSMEWSVQQSIASKDLAERLAGWRERFPDVTVHPRVVWDNPADYLLDEAKAAQLLVVGSHGRGGFAGMVLGSVSTAVAHAARIPVIVARQR
ncbi:universal stress protein [Mycobacterium sp.]|uniref:universal stress protein n=1 Tax=Mycobacterium sp. TaxID=1785 RepID=UPI003BB1728A